MQEIRVSRFEVLPPVIKNIIIINVLVFMAQKVFGNSDFINMEDTFALHTWQSPLFKPWQFLTYMFMHGSIDHIFFNMLALWMFGSTLENLWGPKKFLTFYLICGLGAALAHMVALYYGTHEFINSATQLLNNFDQGHFQNFYAKYNMEGRLTEEGIKKVEQWYLDPGNRELRGNMYAMTQGFVESKINEPTLGASGAVFGCLAAFGYLFPNTYIYMYFMMPIKAKWLVLAYAGVELLQAIENSAGDNVAHIAHLGGALFGLILVYFWNKTNRKTFY